MNYYGMLASLAINRFGLPTDEAENAIHEVFVAYLLNVSPIRNAKGWLVGAISNFCREYWRRQPRGQPCMAGVTLQDSDGKILSSQVLAQLPLSSQMVLRLHYIEGLTAPEIAARLRTSPEYAKLMIQRGVRRARGLLRR